MKWNLLLLVLLALLFSGCSTQKCDPKVCEFARYAASNPVPPFDPREAGISPAPASPVSLDMGTSTEPFVPCIAFPEICYTIMVSPATACVDAEEACVIPNATYIDVPGDCDGDGDRDQDDIALFLTLEGD